MDARRTRLWVGAIVLLVMVCGASPVWAGLDLKVGVAISDLSLGEALLVGAVGQFFGLDTHIVPFYRERQKMSLPEVLLTMYLAKLGDCDHHRVAGLKSQGHGWGRIAKDLGIHPGTFNKLRKGFDVGKATDLGFEETVLIWFLAEYYGKDQASVLKMKKGKYPLLSIFLALDLSSKSGKSVGHLLGENKKGKSWKAVAASAGLSNEALKKPGKPKRGKEFRGGNDDSSHVAGGPGEGEGQDKPGNGNEDKPSSEASDDTGNGKSEKPDKDESKGKGQGKGQ